MKFFNAIIVTIILLQNYENVQSQNGHDDILALIFKTNDTSFLRPPGNNNINSYNTTTINNNDNDIVYSGGTDSNNGDQITPTTTISLTSIQGYDYCGENKICVPFYLCRNGTNSLNTDGEFLIDIRGDYHKTCKPYLQTCCHINDQTSNDTVVTSKPIIDTKTENKCGYRNADGIVFRITHNTDGESEYGEFPWMIAVLRQEYVDGEVLIIYKCGGSLIHPSVVLTAAHCVYKYNQYDLIVRAGEWDTQTKDEYFMSQDRKISNVMINEKFNKINLRYDIALLFTTEPFQMNPHVKTICLPPSGMNFDNYRLCYATGWGKDVFGIEGKYQTIMKKIDLPMVSNGVCEAKLRQTRLGNAFKLHKSFVCAGGEVGKDACRGDGGSPLVCPIKNQKLRYYQSGMVAWGIGCGTSAPGVYVNIAFLREWIDNIFNDKNLDSSYYVAS